MRKGKDKFSIDPLLATITCFIIVLCGIYLLKNNHIYNKISIIETKLDTITLMTSLVYAQKKTFEITPNHKKKVN